MPITRKEFEIIALSEEGREFIIEEKLFVFNQCIWVNTITLEDGLPFVNYFSAKKAKEKLEKQEKNCTFVQREGKICLTLIITSLIAIILWATVCKNFI